MIGIAVAIGRMAEANQDGGGESGILLRIGV
jgi:hypothetical protein